MIGRSLYFFFFNTPILWMPKSENFMLLKWVIFFRIFLPGQCRLVVSIAMKAGSVINVCDTVKKKISLILCPRGHSSSAAGLFRIFFWFWGLTDPDKGGFWQNSWYMFVTLMRWKASSTVRTTSCQHLMILNAIVRVLSLRIFQQVCFFSRHGISNKKLLRARKPQNGFINSSAFSTSEASALMLVRLAIGKEVVKGRAEGT